MRTEDAVTRFGWPVVHRAYDAGRITFDSDAIIFVQ